jgi:hypothetical protein
LPLAAKPSMGELTVVIGSMCLWMSLLLFIGARASVWREDWTLRKSRRRLAAARKAREEASRLGESWTATFDSVRAGQRLGAGTPKGVWSRGLVQYAVAATVFVFVGSASFLAYAMAAFGSVNELMFDEFGGSVYGATVDRLRKLQRLQRLRLPYDTTISAQAAGTMLKSFSTDGALVWPTHAEERYARDARRLSAAARDTLRRAAAHPQLPAFRAFARARTYDYFGVAVPLAKLDSMHLGQIPVMKYAALRQVAGGNFAAGVLAMAEGRNAEAEVRFKELLSAGFLMISQGAHLMDALVGRTVVIKGRTGLSALYQQTGRSADASFVSEASDPADAIVVERQLRLDQRQARVSAMRVLTDTSMFRAVKMEVLFFPLSYGPCGDLNQILFGVDSAYTNALASVRKELVRFPSDSVIFDKVSLALERPMRDGFGDGGFEVAILAPVARVVDFLTRSKRMQSCVSMLS